ncbi:putative reverse transcriptase domain-containing protein [Tanacetum coccineum]
MAPKRATMSNIALEITNTTSITNAQLQAMINQGVSAALAARDANRNNGDDSHNLGAGVRRTERTARECTYTDFLKCQPLNFKGTEGVAGLSQWFERMKSVFHISNCTVENQFKFATCTLHSVALTWWNTHVKTVSHDIAYGMPWKILMKMMTDKYCPRNEIKKLEIKIWDLKVKGTDLTSYTQRFSELALLCGMMFPEEFDKIEKYVGGLPDMIHESIVVSKPKTMQDAGEIETELMDKKIRTFAERQTESKRKFLKEHSEPTTTIEQEAEHWPGLHCRIWSTENANNVQIRLLAMSVEFMDILRGNPGHLAARLGCAETKVATWDDLAFKFIILRRNVKHSTDIAKISRNWSKPDKHGHGKGKRIQEPENAIKGQQKSTHGQQW